MKKYLIVLPLLASIFLLLGASVWEGAAAVSSDFPNGLYVATNSFPLNTVVDLTNLETGKTVRVIVSASLDSPGLLALLSREAAEAVDLQNRTIGRIRMIAPSDPIAFSRFGSDPIRSGDPDYDPMAAVENAYGTTTPVTEISVTPAEPPMIAAPVPEDTPVRRDPESAWTDTPAPVVPVIPPVTEPPLTEAPPPVKVPDYPQTSDPPPAPPVAEVPAIPVEPPVTELPPVVTVPEPVENIPDPAYSYNYTLIPADERPPQDSNFSGSRDSGGNRGSGTVPQIFSVPAVANLEYGKYYLQIGAYSHTAAVEQELSRIERGYPLTIQCIENSERPVYRILIGPVNQGESGALLRSFKGRGYKDAFIRKGE
ncbi:hypothetical protein AGMMS50230_22200 [Spirochaetia bacterium]|nr:hypothetical protein AGMMS50230_22200 [Spirochaetia bacterium]